MTILEEELSAALRELMDSAQAMVEALELHSDPDHKIGDRYDDAIVRAQLVLARAGRAW